MERGEPFDLSGLWNEVFRNAAREKKEKMERSAKEERGRPVDGG